MIKHHPDPSCLAFIFKANKIIIMSADGLGPGINKYHPTWRKLT